MVYHVMLRISAHLPLTQLVVVPTFTGSNGSSSNDHVVMHNGNEMELKLRNPTPVSLHPQRKEWSNGHNAHTHTKMMHLT